MSWFRQWREWRQQRLLRKVRIDAQLWAEVAGDALVHYRLSPDELDRLRDLASLFLHRKVISGAGGLSVSDYQCTVIAAVACLPILELGLDWYRGWVEVILYPDTFVVDHDEVDDAGVIHQHRAELGGEAWGQGPVILSWEDARPGAQGHGEGSNVILHEFAHKLDMCNGAANGMPPLHKDMDRAAWTREFEQAYTDLQVQIDRREPTSIDPYGAEHPAEFFAVATEEFFELPIELGENYPALYDQLRTFYRQDPASR